MTRDNRTAAPSLADAVLLYEEIVRMARMYREEGGTYREDLEALYDYAWFLFRHKEYRRAVEAGELLDSFYDPADTDPDHMDNRARLYTLLGRCALAQEEYEDAEPRLRDALSLYRRLLDEGEDAEPEVAAGCGYLAEVYTRTYRYGAAARLWREALERYLGLEREEPGEYTRELAEACHSLAPFLDGRRTVRGTFPAEKVRQYRICDDALWDTVADREGAHQAELDVALELLDGLLPEIHFPDEGARLLAEAEAEAARRTADHPDGYDAALAEICLDKADKFRDTDRIEDGEVLARRAVELLEPLAEADPDTYEVSLARSYNRLGVLICRTKRPKECETVYHKALNIRRQLARENPSDENEKRVAYTCHDLAGLLRENDRLEEAEPYYSEALDVHRGLVEKDSISYARYYLRTGNGYAVLLMQMGYYEQSEQLFREALDFYREHGDGEPESETVFAVAKNSNAILLKKTGRIQEAEAYCREAMESLRRLAEPNPGPNNQYLADVCNNLAGLELEANHNPAVAVKLLEEAVDLYHRYPNREQDESDARSLLSVAKAALGEQMQNRNRYYGG
ncbi:MAG: tetratricopeptide repeat protein [Oscillibacter sp.]|nr:tetratricopeptide repeat protein [Oscillibacter sp.]